MKTKNRLLRPLPLALILSLLFIAVPIVLGPVWETNDDPAMAFILSRAGNNYSPFQWRGLSVVLNLLYTNLPAVEWWAVCQFFCIWVSAFVFAFLTLRRYPAWKGFLLSIFQLMLLWFTVVYRLNFTRTAIAVATAGCLLTADCAFAKKMTKGHWVEFLIGCILLILGASIRHASAMISLGYLAVTGFMLLITDRFRFKADWFKSHLRPMVMLVIVAAVFFTSWIANDRLLSEKQQDYQHYNTVRSSIQDYASRYPAYADAAAEYEAAGINETAYNMYRNWFSEDTEVFTIEVLEDFSALGTITPEPQFSTILEGQVLLTLLAAALLLLLIPLKRGNWLRNGAMAAVMAGLCLYLALSGRIPDRVFQPILLVASVSAVFVSAPDRQKETAEETNCRSLKNIAFSAIMILLLGVGVFRSGSMMVEDLRSDLKETSEARALYNRQILDQIDADQDHLYFFDITYNPASLNSAFGFWEPRPTTYCANRFDLGGWDPRHPYYVDLLEKQGITNPVRALFERKDVYSTYSGRLLEYLHTFYDPGITVSDTKVMGGVSFAQYTLPIDESQLVLNPEKKAAVRDFYKMSEANHGMWYFSAIINDPQAQEREFYCNIHFHDQSHTYRLHCEDNQLTATLYGIDGHHDLSEAQIRLFEKTDAGYEEYDITMEYVDLLPYLTEYYDCQITNRATGITVSNTAADPQLIFALPEFEGKTVLGVEVEMAVSNSSVAQVFVATDEISFCQEYSAATVYRNGKAFCIIGSPARDPQRLRLDPTVGADQTIQVRSIRLILVDADLIPEK